MIFLFLSGFTKTPFSVDVPPPKLTRWQCKNINVDAFKPEPSVSERISEYTSIRPESQQYQHWYSSEGKSFKKSSI